MGEQGQREDEKMARALTAKRVLKVRKTLDAIPTAPCQVSTCKSPLRKPGLPSGPPHGCSDTSAPVSSAWPALGR